MRLPRYSFKYLTLSPTGFQAYSPYSARFPYGRMPIWKSDILFLKEWITSLTFLAVGAVTVK